MPQTAIGIELCLRITNRKLDFTRERELTLEMNSCRKCGTEIADRTLSCPHCGASQTLDVRLSIVAMKLLGVLCGIVGVGLLVFGDQIDGSNPYLIWLFAGVFLVLGFIFFYRKWAERGDS